VSAADVREWVPAGPGHVLITSRNPVWGGLAGKIPVDVLPRAEAVALLRRRVDGLGEHLADRLAGELGDLPLALEQAAAYLERTGVPPAAYLDQFRTRRARMLALGEDLAYRGTVDTAWSLTLAELEHASPAAAVLLQLCALLAPEPVPLTVFTAHPGLLPEPLRSAVAGDPVAGVDGQVAAALGFSMCRRHGDTVQVHRLVQAVVAGRLPGGERAALADAARRLLAAAAPGDADDPGTWPRWSLAGPHLLAVGAGLGVDDRHGLRRAVDLFCWHLYARGDYHAARRLDTQLLAGYRAALGPDHPDTLSMANNLSAAVRALGDYRAAKELDEDTLARCRRALGPDHRATLRAANDLAVDSTHLGEYEASRELHRENLARSRRVLGEGHLWTLNAANNLAITLRRIGDFGAAHGMDVEALAGYRAVLPENHPSVLTSASNVAEDLHGLGEHEAARRLHEEVLARRRIYLGADHPYTLRSAGYLADVLRALGDARAARELGEDTLERRRRVLGAGHPYTVQTARGLAGDLRALGEDEMARRVEDEFGLREE
jgi:hypothetical protein